MESKPKNTLYIQVIIFVVVFAIAFFGTRYFMKESSNNDAKTTNEIKR
jgi:flagellar basal body-associated protein FliL